MRPTEVGALFTWSKSRCQLLYCSGFLRLPSPLWLLVVLMLLFSAATSGVGEEIGINSVNCCGMRLNNSRCRINLACVCEDCGNETQEGTGVALSTQSSYRLEFCSSFPINVVLNGALHRNRTFCQQQLNNLQGVDNETYQNYKSFEGIIQRTDCGETTEANTYSATSTCVDCLEAYKHWICFTRLLAATKSKKRSCVDLCQTVLQKCPHFLPVPNDGENLVQVGYSAFNCPDSDWKQEYRDSDECLHVDPMVKCKQNNYASTMQPTTNLPTGNSTTNSTSNGRR